MRRWIRAINQCAHPVSCAGCGESGWIRTNYVPLRIRGYSPAPPSISTADSYVAEDKGIEPSTIAGWPGFQVLFVPCTLSSSYSLTKSAPYSAKIKTAVTKSVSWRATYHLGFPNPLPCLGRTALISRTAHPPRYRLSSVPPQAEAWHQPESNRSTGKVATPIP